MPTRIAQKEELFLGLALYLNAWFDLDTERVRADYQKITRSSCFDYARDYGLSEEQTEDLWFYINRMDREFLAWWQKKQPKAKEPRVKRGRKP